MGVSDALRYREKKVPIDLLFTIDVERRERGETMPPYGRIRRGPPKKKKKKKRKKEKRNLPPTAMIQEEKGEKDRTYSLTPRKGGVLPFGKKEERWRRQSPTLILFSLPGFTPKKKVIYLQLPSSWIKEERRM